MSSVLVPGLPDAWRPIPVGGGHLGYLPKKWADLCTNLNPRVPHKFTGCHTSVPRTSTCHANLSLWCLHPHFTARFRPQDRDAKLKSLHLSGSSVSTSIFRGCNVPTIHIAFVIYGVGGSCKPNIAQWSWRRNAWKAQWSWGCNA